MHMSLHNMTPSITSAAMTERSGISSHGVDTALRSHIDKNDGMICSIGISFNECVGIAEEGSLASLDSSDESNSLISDDDISLILSHTSDTSNKNSTPHDANDHGNIVELSAAPHAGRRKCDDRPFIM